MAERTERVYTVNIRDARDVPRAERARKAIVLIRLYLQRHMKGDVVMGRGLNEYVWSRGIKTPPVRVKIRATKDGNTIRAELLGVEKERIKTAEKVGETKETDAQKEKDRK